MNRGANFIIKHRKLCVVLFVSLALAGLLFQFFVKINYSMEDYLPKEARSTQALSIMAEEFDEEIPNARVMIHHVDLQEALEYKLKLSHIEGVASVMWLDDEVDLKVPLEMLDSKTVENYYRDGTALFTVTIREGMEVAAIDDIYECIGEDNAVSGDALNIATSQKMAGEESLNAMLILVPLITLILLISTSSWIEPVLFLLAIGVSVLINLGTNIFMGEISFVTQAISPILQLAVSLDYAIFLLHSFSDYRQETGDIKKAMQMAMKKAFPAIAASAATTLFGFMALMLMEFRIGVDLGLNLVKGILLSFISVMVFLPALTICLHKWIDKTKHKVLMPRFKCVSFLVAKLKIPCMICVLVLLIPAFLAQGRNSFTYGMGDLSEKSRSGSDTIAIDKTFGKATMLVLLVPKGEVSKELELSKALGKVDHVTTVMSFAATVGNTVPAKYLDDTIVSRFYSENYSRMILSADTDTEGDTAFEVVRQVQSLAGRYYGDAFYACGQSVNLYDMKNIVTKDNSKVNLFAIAAIALVLFVTFKSLVLPVILLITIEGAIWMNLSVPYFSGQALCYIGFLVINTVQLGATVDYAILLTHNYMGYRTTLSKKMALKETLHNHFSSVLVSASVLSLAGFCLFFTSSNPIVSQLGLLLGRGTLLSMVLVVFFLPVLLTSLDRLIQKTTWKANFKKEG